MRRALAVALSASLWVGCFAAPPPAAVPTELGGCHPGSHGARSAMVCRRDADCLLCATPGDRCGVLSTRARVEISNAPCPPVGDESCGGVHAACCGGRCVVSLGPPPL